MTYRSLQTCIEEAERLQIERDQAVDIMRQTHRRAMAMLERDNPMDALGMLATIADAHAAMLSLLPCADCHEGADLGGGIQCESCGRVPTC